MSDASVEAALRSDARLVVIEAPAGTGKTYQAAGYARETAAVLQDGRRILILTHTHAACGVFAARTAGMGSRVRIGTIDSLCAQIATAYHRALDLPADVTAWSRAQGPDGFDQLARKVQSLLTHSSAVAGALAARYPVVICDEHQDASDAQHGVTTALGIAGARMLIFGDPMQSIYGTAAERQAQQLRWQSLIRSADLADALDRPHRWESGSPALGAWILAARRTLADGDRIDLRGARPSGLQIIEAENQAPRHGSYQLGRDERRQIDAIVRARARLLVLSSHNATVRGLNAFWARRIPIWEGHTRDALSGLIAACRRHEDDAPAIARALCHFVQGVGIGFTATNYGNDLIREVETGCTARRRAKPALIQQLAGCLVQSPNHVGVGRALTMLHGFMGSEPTFQDISIDLRREFHEARRLGTFNDPEQGFAVLNHRRAQLAPPMPRQAISTIHKAKGLECENAMVLPCDDRHFPESAKNRSLLYVALSRASHSLTLVVSRASPCPLIQQ